MTSCSSNIKWKINILLLFLILINRVAGGYRSSGLIRCNVYKLRNMLTYFFYYYYSSERSMAVIITDLVCVECFVSIKLLSLSALSPHRTVSPTVSSMYPATSAVQSMTIWVSGHCWHLRLCAAWDD